MYLSNKIGWKRLTGSHQSSSSVTLCMALICSVAATADLLLGLISLASALRGWVPLWVDMSQQANSNGYKCWMPWIFQWRTSQTSGTQHGQLHLCLLSGFPQYLASSCHDFFPLISQVPRLIFLIAISLVRWMMLSHSGSALETIFATKLLCTWEDTLHASWDQHSLSLGSISGSVFGCSNDRALGGKTSSSP